jgi:acylphosphatase
MTKIVKKAIVSGRVQGVFYRATTKNAAVKLNLTGYAKNLPDGTVEVLAVGEGDNVDSLIKWLWTGSRASKVTDVKEIDASDVALNDFSSFSTR